MNPLAQHLNSLPNDLVSALQGEFQKLHQQYFLGKWEPSQLDGGRFAENVFRYLEYKQTKKFTPIGTQIARISIYNSVSQDTTLPESLRFHVLKLADLILDFRNKRNVAHPGTVDVNEMDSTLVLHAANWIVAELIRVETQMNPTDAQREIQKITERKVPIIEEIGGRLKVLNPKLNIRDKVLVILYQKFPQEIPETDLLDWSEYDSRHKDRFSSYLKELNDKGLIDYRSAKAVLTKRGVIWVEKNVQFELDI